VSGPRAETRLDFAGGAGARLARVDAHAHERQALALDSLALFEGTGGHAADSAGRQRVRGSGRLARRGHWHAELGHAAAGAGRAAQLVGWRWLEGGRVAGPRARRVGADALPPVGHDARSRARQAALDVVGPGAEAELELAGGAHFGLAELVSAHALATVLVHAAKAQTVGRRRRRQAALDARWAWAEPRHGSPARRGAVARAAAHAQAALRQALLADDGHAAAHGITPGAQTWEHLAQLALSLDRAPTCASGWRGARV
jgi:hypothetical protein